MAPVTVVIVDDHHLVRQGVRAVLEGPGKCSVIGEAANGSSGLQVIEALQPDVVVLDLVLPDMSGLDMLQVVALRSRESKVIVLSMHDNEVYAMHAISKGAAAYVIKGSRNDDLLDAVHAVTAGRHYYSPALSQHTMEAYISQAPSAPIDRYDELTAREREVLHQVAEGATNAAIAERLMISPRTVESYRATLMRKLDLHTQADLIRYAIRRGLIPL